MVDADECENRRADTDNKKQERCFKRLSRDLWRNLICCENGKQTQACDDRTPIDQKQRVGRLQRSLLRDIQVPEI
jgi:hypothetical protein